MTQFMWYTRLCSQELDKVLRAIWSSLPHLRISETAILVLGGHQYLIPILDTQLHCREYALLVFGKDI